MQTALKAKEEPESSAINMLFRTEKPDGQKKGLYRACLRADSGVFRQENVRKMHTVNSIAVAREKTEGEVYAGGQQRIRVYPRAGQNRDACFSRIYPHTGRRRMRKK